MILQLFVRLIGFSSRDSHGVRPSGNALYAALGFTAMRIRYSPRYWISSRRLSRSRFCPCTKSWPIFRPSYVVGVPYPVTIATWFYEYQHDILKGWQICLCGYYKFNVYKKSANPLQKYSRLLMPPNIKKTI